MLDKVLALYDTTEIQKYIYSSNKLKDNIGASLLVEESFSKYLVNSIKKVLGAESCKVNWMDNTELEILEKKHLDAEVIYIGGGNALILYRNDNVYKKVNYEFSKTLLEKAPELKFVTCCKTISNNFVCDINELFKLIRNKKLQGNAYCKLRALPITRQCNITNAPVVDLLNNEYLSQEILVKRKRVSDFKKENNKYCVYDRFDKLAGIKGDSYIAVVHIDGNNMGKKMNEILKNTSKYNEAVKAIRKFSCDIQKIYEETYKNMLEEVENAIVKKANDFKELRECFIHNNEIIAPFRKILIKGDDITFVCYGKFALSAVEKFFQILIKNYEKYNYTSLSACAGIAFIKPHYPFSKAYDIAESCCKNAKKVAKSEKGKKVGNYMDFHIVHSQMCGSLNSIRKKQYNVYYLSNKKKANRDFETFNLLWRPYKFNSESQKDFTFFKQLMTHIVNECPRSKLKDLRSAFLEGEDAIVNVLKSIESRKKNIVIDSYELDDKLFSIEDYNTPYFDVLEMMDLYIDLFQ